MTVVISSIVLGIITNFLYDAVKPYFKKNKSDLTNSVNVVKSIPFKKNEKCLLIHTDEIIGEPNPLFSSLTEHRRMMEKAKWF